MKRIGPKIQIKGFELLRNIVFEGGEIVEDLNGKAYIITDEDSKMIDLETGSEEWDLDEDMLVRLCPNASFTTGEPKCHSTKRK